VNVGLLERGEAHARAELEMSRALVAHDFAVWALVSLGHVERSRGLLNSARASYEGALALAREGDKAEVAAATGALGQVALLERDFERAADLAQQSIDLAASAHWDSGVANGRIELAQAQLAQGRIAESVSRCAGIRGCPRESSFPRVCGSPPRGRLHDSER
jgi:hypothetical protein